MDEQLIWGEEEVFSDIYVYDNHAREKIQTLVEGKECNELIERAIDLGSALPLLEELIPDKKSKPLTKLRSYLNPFDVRKEYNTKEDYLLYLKQAYGLMMCSLEVPPGMILGIFYPGYKRTWTPSKESSIELLKKFYVEVKLINELTPMQWKKVRNATNPEAVMAKMLYGTKFKPEFRDFLRRIPWILASDAYGSPGLDLVYRRAPGHEISKKPFGVGDSFLNNLVRSSLDNQAHILLGMGDEGIRLKAKDQITEQIESEGSATLDTFIGLSKIERDFVIHQRIIIWENPGFERYQDASFLNRIRYAKPPRYLCAIREQALPLDIPYLERKFDKYRKYRK